MHLVGNMMKAKRSDMPNNNNDTYAKWVLNLHDNANIKLTGIMLILSSFIHKSRFCLQIKDVSLVKK